MVTVIRQHIDGYITFLMYNDTTHCVMSYCKKTKTIKLTFRSNGVVTHLHYEDLNDNLITYVMDVIQVYMTNDDMSNFDSDGIKACNICIRDIRKHVRRRFIPSLKKSYSSVSSFNPKNRRVIFSK